MELGFRDPFNFQSHTENCFAPSLPKKEVGLWKVSPWELVGTRCAKKVVASNTVTIPRSQSPRFTVAKLAVASTKWNASRLIETQNMGDFDRNE
jgi:hypothetical protein